MSAHHNVGTAVPGPVTPASDNARWQAGVRGQSKTDRLDCATRTTAVVCWLRALIADLALAIAVYELGRLLRRLGVLR